MSTGNPAIDARINGHHELAPYYHFTETVEIPIPKIKKIFSWGRVRIAKTQDLSRIIGANEYETLSEKKKSHCVPATEAHILQYGGVAPCTPKINAS